ncbi:extracellular alpha-1 4-glucan glucosidase [Fusarium beomiforme]|uniref:Extracellular alpha-1 4-glucan glucosidase n=1 Tax=Fusarium beomiforme TaxID=44412 RepID=A0A9P5AB47_9HYPO|nr:extracellular alpha-1 4-glucan glucosidase [Fusarium beomiforme]
MTLQPSLLALWALLPYYCSSMDIVNTNDSTVMAAAVFGNSPGVNIISSYYGGADDASGTFTNGPFGIGSGVILTTGNVTNALPGNASPYGYNGVHGNGSFCAPGFQGLDAAQLFITIELQPGYNGLVIEMIMASIDPKYGDSVGVFVDGVDYAKDENGTLINSNSNYLKSPLAIVPPASDTSYTHSSPPLLFGIPISSGQHNLTLSTCDNAVWGFDTALMVNAQACVNCNQPIEFDYVTTSTTITSTFETTYTTTIQPSHTFSGTVEFTIVVTPTSSTTTSADSTTLTSSTASSTTPACTQLGGTYTEPSNSIFQVTCGSIMGGTRITSKLSISFEQCMDLCANTATCIVKQYLGHGSFGTANLVNIFSFFNFFNHFSLFNSFIIFRLFNRFIIFNFFNLNIIYYLSTAIFSFYNSIFNKYNTYNLYSLFYIIRAHIVRIYIRILARIHIGIYIPVFTRASIQTSTIETSTSIATSGVETSAAVTSISIESSTSKTPITATTAIVVKSTTTGSNLSSTSSSTTQAVAETDSTATSTNEQTLPSTSVQSSEPSNSSSLTTSITSSTPSVTARNIPIFQGYKFAACLRSPEGFPTFTEVATQLNMTTETCIKLAAGSKYIGIYEDLLLLLLLLLFFFYKDYDSADFHINIKVQSYQYKSNNLSPGLLVFLLLRLLLFNDIRNTDSYLKIQDVTYTKAGPAETITIVTYVTINPSNANLITTWIPVTLLYTPCGCDHQTYPLVDMTTIVSSCYACGYLGEEIVTLVVPVAACEDDRRSYGHTVDPVDQFSSAWIKDHHIYTSNDAYVDYHPQPTQGQRNNDRPDDENGPSYIEAGTRGSNSEAQNGQPVNPLPTQGQQGSQPDNKNDQPSVAIQESPESNNKNGPIVLASRSSNKLSPSQLSPFPQGQQISLEVLTTKIDVVPAPRPGIPTGPSQPSPIHKNQQVVLTTFAAEAEINKEIKASKSTQSLEPGEASSITSVASEAHRHQAMFWVMMAMIVGMVFLFE